MTSTLTPPDAFIPADEAIGELICQNGVRPGSIKLTQFVKACMLRGVPPLYSTEDIPCDDKVAYVKLFDPCGSWSWFITEYSREAPDGTPHLAFGMVHGHEHEYGYISLPELAELKGQMGIGIEIDCWFRPTRIGDLESAD